jgi:hypothetical protein
MNGTPPQNLASSNRLLRIIHVVFCIHLVAIIGIAEYVRKPDATYSGALFIPFLAVSATLVGVFFFTRSKIGASEAALVQAPEDRSLIAKRHQLQIFLFAFSEAVVLFGFLTRFMGASLTQSVPFYAAGLFLILLSSPRKLD